MGKRWAGLPLRANSPAEMLGKLELAAMSKNGATPDYPGIPALTQSDALTLFEYFRWLAVDNLVEWADWYPFALCALGYDEPGPGDRFAHQPDAYVTSACAARMWSEWLPALVAEVETTTDPKRPRDFNPSTNTYARWKRIADLAWAKMKKDRAARGVPLPPIPEPPVKPPMPPRPPGAGDVFLWLAVGWLIYETVTGDE